MHEATFSTLSVCAKRQQHTRSDRGEKFFLAEEILRIGYGIGSNDYGEIVPTEQIFKETYLIPKSTKPYLRWMICPVLLWNVPSSVGEIFDRIHNRLSELSDGGHHKQSDLLFRPETDLTDDQWAQLDRCHADLQAEYNLRRVMITTRLDLTMTSFKWKAKTSLEVARLCRQIKRTISALADSLSKRDISDLLVTKLDLLRLEKVASTRFKGSRKNVLQGNLVLPNRGGVFSVEAKLWMPVWSSREEGQPCQNLRQKHGKPPKVQTEPTKDHQSEKKSKSKQREGSGDIEETELNLD